MIFGQLFENSEQVLLKLRKLIPEYYVKCIFLKVSQYFQAVSEESDSYCKNEQRFAVMTGELQNNLPLLNGKTKAVTSNLERVRTNFTAVWDK